MCEQFFVVSPRTKVHGVLKVLGETVPVDKMHTEVREVLLTMQGSSST